MTDTTPNLNLPYILPSQAMKHITHNEALQILDATTHAVIVASLSTPPASPVEGALYLVGASATSDWSGKDGRLAFFIDGAWIFLVPRTGWRAWFAEDGRTRVFDGTAWTDPLSSPSIDRLGISATADVTNRLAVSSDASLFNHAGHSHRMKLNKQAAADTASLLFQSDWSGRAEIGLLGNDALQFKTSPDGSGWSVGLEISGDGIARMPARPIVSATLASATYALASGHLVGFDTMSVMQGGFQLGPALAGGRGKPLIAPAAGLYMIAMRANLQATGAASLAIAINGTASNLRWNASAATSPVVTAGVTGILSLAAGDAVALVADGPLSLQTGADAYELGLRLL
ncbi:Protein of unknown function [Ensifer adhaerens]|nr:Protein of unknown function [Ensifer adhaerens]